MALPNALSDAVPRTRFRSSRPPPCFPASGPIQDPSLPSAGSLRQRFPDFIGTMKRLRRPSSIPPRFVSFAWPYLPAPASSSITHRPGAAFACLGLFTGLPTVILEGESGVLPGSSGSLVCLCPASRSRPSLRAMQFGAAVSSPNLSSIEGLVRLRLFRDSITRPQHSLATLHPLELPPVSARLASGGWPPCRMGLGTHRVPLKGF